MNKAIWTKRFWGTGERQYTLTRNPVVLPDELLAVLKYQGRDQTERRIHAFEAAGWTIVDGNDYRLAERPKYDEFFVVKLRQTNSRRHGRCEATTWAIKKP